MWSPHKSKLFVRVGSEQGTEHGSGRRLSEAKSPGILTSPRGPMEEVAPKDSEKKPLFVWLIRQVRP